MRTFLLIPLLIAGVFTASAGASPTAPSTCTISPSTVPGATVNVTATGLPTDAQISFYVTGDSGTTGWVLGYTSSGTFSVDTFTDGAVTKYQFVTVSGPHDRFQAIWSECSTG